MTKADFLIRLGSTKFWTRNAGSTPYGVAEPSRASHLTYEQADRVCRELRGQGYQAVVTNLWGQPVGLAELVEARAYIIRSALLPGDYFVRYEDGHMVVTHDLTDAFRAGYSVIAAVAEDLQTSGEKVEILDVTDADPRQRDEYRRAMGTAKQVLATLQGVGK
jgi:hypothetical protein